MSKIDLYWDDDAQTIMVAHLKKGWAWHELFETLADIKRVTEKRSDEVAAVVMMERGANVPNGSVFSAETRDKARLMLQMGAEGKGPIAIVGMNMLIKAVARAFTILDKNALDDVYFADTLKEARAVLRQRLAAAPTTQRTTA